MSEERQMFSVAELVEAVGAPRTTINDWLTRYAKYIDYEMRGKRKVYFLSSVQVLGEIAELRNIGKSGYEIEEELMRRHPLRPEPIGKNGTIPAKEGEEVQEETAMALAVQQNAELTRVVQHEFATLAERVNSYDRTGQQLTRRMRWLGFGIFSGFLVMIAIALVGVMIMLNWMSMQNAEAARVQGANQEKLLSELTESKQNLLNAIARGDSQLQSDYEKKFETLLSELTKRANSEAKITELQKELQEFRNDVSERIKTEVAAQRQTYEDRLAKSEAERRYTDDQLAQSRQTIEELNEKLATRERELEALRAQVATVPAAETIVSSPEVESSGEAETASSVDTPENIAEETK